MNSSRRHFIIVHRGDSWYLPYCLLQASRFIPREQIVLITDIKHRRYEKWCRVEDIASHWEEAKKLEANFENFSPLGAPFELFCIQRWFVIKSFVQKNGIQRIVHLDSDVMVFTELDALLTSYDGFDFANTGFQGPHCLCINNPALLPELCGFIASHYEDPQLKNQMRTDFARWLSEGKVGGISDMHFLHSFKTAFAERFKFGNNAGGANGIILHDNCLMDDKSAARIVFHSGVPFEIGDDGKERQLALIHCQGMYKKMMPGLSSRKDLAYRGIALRRKFDALLAKFK